MALIETIDLHLLVHHKKMRKQQPLEVCGKVQKELGVLSFKILNGDLHKST